MREVVIFSTDERGLFPNNFMVDCPVVCQHLFLSTPNVCQQKTFDNNRVVHFETNSKMFFAISPQVSRLKTRTLLDCIYKNNDIFCFVLVVEQ